MKLKALLAMMFSLLLVFGLATFASAQANPDKPKAADKQKDDDGDDEEDDSPEMQAKLAKEAKISIEQARATALERVAGTITEEEIEIEKGVLVYSIEIRDANGKTQDVEVNAKTGEIVRVEKEDDDDEDDNNAKKQKKIKDKTVRKFRSDKKPF